eukprot:jgi/Botrbrau1/9006/Bobra.0148s0109.1
MSTALRDLPARVSNLLRSSSELASSDEEKLPEELLRLLLCFFVFLCNLFTCFNVSFEGGDATALLVTCSPWLAHSLGTGSILFTNTLSSLSKTSDGANQTLRGLNLGAADGLLRTELE